MAVTERITIIANPARKKRRNPMTLQQKLRSGLATVRKAARRELRAKAKRKSARHTPRRKPNPPRPKRAAARKQHRPAHPHRKKTATRRRTNPGEIISLTLGNPARKRGLKAMAKATKKKKTHHASAQRNAGRRRPTKRNPGRHHRRNPGGYQMMDLLALGGGAVIGSSVPKLASQAVLGGKNTGAMGYLANLTGTFVLAWAAHKFVPRTRMLAAGILAGGIGQLIARAIGDYTQFGSYLSGAGMGDYMAANWVTPQRLPDALNSSMAENGYQAPQLVVASAAAGAGVGALVGPPLY